MRTKNLNLILFISIFASTNVLAEDKLWTVSTGLSYRDSNFNLPGNKNNNESWNTNLGLTRQLNAVTWVGGSLSYSDSDIRYTSLNGKGSIDTTSVSAYITRNIAWGLFATGSLGYGQFDINNKFPATQLKTDADYKTASLGLTQYLPISENLMAALNARYTHLSTNIDSFIATGGQAVGSSDNNLNYVTLGGRLNYKINSFTPYVRLDWLKASREFIQNTGDDDYYNYGLGVNYAIQPETNIGLSFDSVFDRRFFNENSLGINLSHRF